MRPYPRSRSKEKVVSGHAKEGVLGARFNFGKNRSKLLESQEDENLLEAKNPRKQLREVRHLMVQSFYYFS